MNYPLVSIVLPTYNRRAMLPVAIRSCLEQSCGDLELIVVDDGSTDGTLEVARQWTTSDPRVKIVTQTNSGLPAALNRGFSEALGKYWTWTSDDNRYHPEALAAMLHELETHPNLGMVYTGFQVVDATGRVRETVRGESPDLLPEKNGVGPCFLYRSECAREVGGYDVKARLVEDWDYWLRLAMKAPLARVEGVYYDYLDHEQTLTRLRQVEVWEAEWTMRHRTPHPQARQKIYCRPVARRLATHYWRKGNRLKALWYRLHSFPL